MRAAVVSAGADRNTLAIGESVHTILADLVTSNHDLQLVHLEEFVDEVRAEERHIVLFKGISCDVRMNSQNIVILSRVTPKELHSSLLSLVVDLSEGDLERPLYLFDVLNLLESGAYTGMNAENFVICTLIVDNGGKRQILKHVV